MTGSRGATVPGAVNGPTAGCRTGIAPTTRTATVAIAEMVSGIATGTGIGTAPEAATRGATGIGAGKADVRGRGSPPFEDQVPPRPATALPRAFFRSFSEKGFCTAEIPANRSGSTGPVAYPVVKIGRAHV